MGSRESKAFVKKIILSLLCTILLIGQIGLVPPVRVEATGGGSSSFSGGSGTVNDPYIIMTATQLNEVRNHLDKHFLLGGNITLSGQWEPIGRYVLPDLSGIDPNAPGFDPENIQLDPPTLEPFTGSFDGNGHKITGLNITNYNGENGVVGLFGFVRDAEIANVDIAVTIDVSSNQKIIAAGGLAGMAESTEISSSSVSGKVEGLSTVGGLIGTADKVTVNDSSSNATVAGTEYTGGLIGSMENSSVVSESFSKGTVTAEEDNVGGLIGFVTASKVSNSYSEADVKGGNNTGGLIGVAINKTTIETSYAKGKVVGKIATGGLVGLARGAELPENATSIEGYETIIKTSYASGRVEGEDSVGGLIGSVEATVAIANTYSTSEVKGKGYEFQPESDFESEPENEGDSSVSTLETTPPAEPVFVGATVGGLIGSMMSSRLKNTYSIGIVSGDNPVNIGGLIGSVYGSEVSDSFYNQQVQTFTELKRAIGEEEESVISEVGGRLTADMKTPLNYEGWGFEIDEELGITEVTWVSNPNGNNGYPFLRFQQEFSTLEHIKVIETPVQRVERAKANLAISGDLTNVTSNLALKTEQNGVRVSWSSSNTGRVSNTGIVTRPAPGQPAVDVTLTATLSFSDNSGQATATKTFNIRVSPQPIRKADVKIMVGQAAIGNASNAAENMLINLNNRPDGFSRTTNREWQTAWGAGEIHPSGDNSISGTLTIDVAANPQLKALAEGGTARVEVGWKRLKFNKFGCFLFWCKTRVTSVTIKDNSSILTSASARGGNVGARSRTASLRTDSKIIIDFWIEGQGAGIDGLYVKFSDTSRPVLLNYTFTGTGEERTNPNTNPANQRELYVKANENISLSYNFSKPVRPSELMNMPEAMYDYFARHPLFVSRPEDSGLPAAGQQQYMRNITYNTLEHFKDNPRTNYHRSIVYQYTGVKYHQSGNLPLTPKIGGITGGTDMEKPLEEKLNDVRLTDAAGNTVEIRNINQASNVSTTEKPHMQHLLGKTVNPFDYENGGYRVIVDAVAPKYSKTANGIQPEILTGVVLDENDEIEFTLQLTEEVIVNKALNGSAAGTYLLFNNGMKARYVSGEGTSTWKFRAKIKDEMSLKAYETPLLKVVALTHENKAGTTPAQLDRGVLQDYAGNLLIQPANFDGIHNEGLSCQNSIQKRDAQGNVTGYDTVTGPCDPSLVNSKIDWANLSIDNTAPVIGFRYEAGGATNTVYRKNGKVTIDANDPALIVPPFDPVNAGASRPSKGIYRPSNMTGPSSPAVGLVYYVWSQESYEQSTHPFSNDNFAAVKRFSLTAKQPWEDGLYPGLAPEAGAPTYKNRIRVVNNKTNMIAPPPEALRAENSGEWYLHTWTADMSWDSARELMQYEKMKTFITNNPDLYQQWKNEITGSEADKVIHANRKALAAVGSYEDLSVWSLADFKHKDSNWVYSKTKLSLDNKAPEVSFTNVNGDNSVNVEVNVIIDDPHSGFSKVDYQWVKKGNQPATNWADPPAFSSSGSVKSQPVTIRTAGNEMIDGDGEYELYIQVTDLAGNRTVKKMENTITVNSTVSMEVQFLPEPNPNYVRSHDVIFQVLSGLNPQEVSYAYSSSIARPSTFVAAEEMIGDIDAILQRLTEEATDQPLEEIVEELPSEEEIIEDNEAEQPDPSLPDEHMEGTEEEQVAEENANEENVNLEETEEETTDNEYQSEEVEENDGLISALFTTISNFVVGIFSTTETEETDESLEVNNVRSYLLLKDETKNGPVYLHVRVKDESGNDYYFNKLYYFNNEGPGIYFSSNGVSFPRESHEVTVTVNYPYSNQTNTLVSVNSLEATSEENGSDESSELTVGNEDNLAIDSDNSEEDIHSIDETSDIPTEGNSESNSNGEETETAVENENNNDSEVGEEESNPEDLVDEENSELDKEEELELELHELTERVELYQWVKGIKTESGDITFTAVEENWFNLPAGGVVTVGQEDLAEGEDVAEFKLFVSVIDELGNEKNAETTGTFKVMRVVKGCEPNSTEEECQPAKSEFDLLYITGNVQSGFTGIVRLELQTEDKRGYEYSLSPDGGTSWTRWRTYTNFAAINLPTNEVEQLNVKVKYRTAAGVIGGETDLNTATLSSIQPVYGLAALSTSRPVSMNSGVDINITLPLGVRVAPASTNPSVPTRIVGTNTFNVKENGYYAFELTDIDNPARTEVLYIVVSNIDSTPPLGDIEYLTTMPTNGNVTVKLITNKPVQVLNNDGRFTYTFTENGTFTFYFHDEAGNEGSAEAYVNYIDKEGPKVKITKEYHNHKTISNGALTSGVTLIVENEDPNDPKSFIVNGKECFVKDPDDPDDACANFEADPNARAVTLTENGYVSFIVSDKFGNTTVVKEHVTNIVSKGPEPEEITYSFVDENGEPVSSVDINGKRYAKGQVKVTLTGKTTEENNVFLGVAPSRKVNVDNDGNIILDENGKITYGADYTNLISNENGEFTVSRTYSAEGTTTIAITDLLGNVNRVPVKIEGLDNIAPEIELNLATVGVEKNKEGFDFQTDLGGFTVTDNVSAPEDIEVTISGLDLSQVGYQRVTYTATDQVGNTTTVQQDVYVVNDAGMLIFANDLLLSADAGLTALFDENTLRFNVTRYNVMNVEGTERLNEWGTYDLLYHSGLYREGQMKYIAEKLTYEQLVNGNFEVTFPKAGWYTIIVRNQEREREYGTFFISGVK